MGYIGDEVNQHLEELLVIANSKDQSGNSLFAGSASKTTPFRTTMGRVPGGSGDMVVSVDYLGNIGTSAAEISEGSDGGGEPARQRGLLGGAAADLLHRGCQPVPRPGTLHHPHRRRRDTPLPGGHRVRHCREDQRRECAHPRAGRLRSPTRWWWRPRSRTRSGRRTSGGGTVLQDLGILAPNSNRPPLNVAPSARVFGGSIFDMVINLRNALFEGSTEKVGGAGLRGLEDSITNLAGVLGAIGARDARLDTVAKRLEYQKPEMVRFDSQERDLDMADAITQLRTLETTHEAALSATARVLNRPKLLDFLR